jgi:hypothetical protein
MCAIKSRAYLCAALATLSVQPSAATADQDACALLSKDEAAQILGVPIERVTAKPGPVESICEYHARLTSTEARPQEVAKRFLDIAGGKQGSEPGAGSGDPASVIRQTGMGDLVKSIGAARRDPDSPYLSVSVRWRDGRPGFGLVKGTIRAQSGGVQTTEALRGIGDDAFLGPLDQFLMFVKGDTAVTIGLSAVPKARDKGIEMARKIGSRL